MKISGRHYRAIWRNGDGTVQVIDQSRLPFSFEIQSLDSAEAAAHAIRTMVVRGAPLIGATAAYGVALAMHGDASTRHLEAGIALLRATRPTAIDLAWALGRMHSALAFVDAPRRATVAWTLAAQIGEDYVEQCRQIGTHGLKLIQALASRRQPVNILTHCNAGWLCSVDWGTALAPIYMAHDAGLSVHVWVDETRPRNQGASLTAYELAAHGIPHTVIADNLAGRHGPRRQRSGHGGRRCLQQGRHLSQSVGGPRHWNSLLCGDAREYHRLEFAKRRGGADRRALAE
jgi:methylthioribose-1-phosphate isomerase